MEEFSGRCKHVHPTGIEKRSQEKMSFFNFFRKNMDGYFFFFFFLGGGEKKKYIKAATIPCVAINNMVLFKT